MILAKVKKSSSVNLGLSIASAVLAKTRRSINCRLRRARAASGTSSFSILVNNSPNSPPSPVTGRFHQGIVLAGELTPETEESLTGLVICCIYLNRGLTIHYEGKTRRIPQKILSLLYEKKIGIFFPAETSLKTIMDAVLCCFIATIQKFTVLLLFYQNY